MPVRLSDLRERRAATLDDLRKLVETAEGEARDFDEGEAARYGELRDRERSIAAQIERREALDSLDRTAAPGEGGETEWRAKLRKFSLFNVIRAQLGDRTVDAGLEAEVGQEEGRRRGRAARGSWVPSEIFSVRAEHAPMELRASAYATGPGNAAIRPVDYRPDQLIDLFRPQLVTNRLGVRFLDGLAGASKVTIPKQTGTTTAYWVNEDQDVPASAGTFAGIELEPHSLGVLSTLSRRLLTTTTPAIEALARADMAATMAQAVDYAFINSEGDGAAPAGLLSLIPGAPGNGLNVVTMGGALNRPKLLAMKAAPKLVNANGEGRWLFSPKVEAKLFTVDTGTPGITYLADAPAASGQILGSPYTTSTLSPDNLGASPNNKSLIAYGDWGECIIGRWSGLDVVTDPYTGAANGSLRIVLFSDMDFAYRRLPALAVAVDALAG